MPDFGAALQTFFEGLGEDELRLAVAPVTNFLTSINENPSIENVTTQAGAIVPALVALAPDAEAVAVKDLSAAGEALVVKLQTQLPAQAPTTAPPTS